MSASNAALCVEVRWGPTRLTSFLLHPRRAAKLSVGAGARADVVLADSRLGERVLELVTATREGFWLRFPRGARGSVLTQQGEVSLRELVRLGEAEEAHEANDARYLLPRDAGFAVQLGGLELHALPARLPPRAAASWDEDVDFVGANGGLFAAMAGVLVWMLLAQEGNGRPDADDGFLPPRPSVALVLPSTERLVPIETQLMPVRRQEPSNLKGQRGLKPGGGRTPGPSKGLSKQLSAISSLIERVAHDGVGSEAITSSLSQVRSVAVASAGGADSLKFGSGGGGGDPLAIGNVDTLGVNGGPKGKNYGAAPLLSGKRTFVPQVSSDGPSDCQGCVDRELIRKYIREHLSQVRYCYESALASHPELAGKVRLQLLIRAGGQVTEARAVEGLSAAPEVGDCVAQRAKSWVFPSMRQDVVVTYPFVFQRGL